MQASQVTVFLAITVLIGLATWWKVRSITGPNDGSGKDVFLAGGGLTWLYVAGSITLTNLSTEQLVGMNGNQMLLLAWWEISGFVGLMILAFIFVPIYYRQGCTTVIELLERRYQGGSIRTVISAIFLLGIILIYLPAALYSGSLFLKSMFGVDWPLLWFAAPIAAAVIAHTSAILNSSVALYAIDFHDKFIRSVTSHWKLAAWTSALLTVTSILLVPAFENAKSIINLLQELNGLSSMPVLSAFIAGLLFTDVDARAAIIGLVFGVASYALNTFVLYKPGTLYPDETFYQYIGWTGLHYIDVMLMVLVASVIVALTSNHLIFGNVVRYVGPGARCDG